jgi:hypothetical protein
MEVPTATSLKDIYPDDVVENQSLRWEKLLVAFKSEYGGPADFVSRSPGRVNLIGEARLLHELLERELIRLHSTLIILYTRCCQWQSLWISCSQSK